MKYSEDECRELVKWARTYCGSAQQDIFDLAAALSERLVPVGDADISETLKLLERGYPWERSFAAAIRQLIRDRHERWQRVGTAGDRDLINANKVLKDEVDLLLRERDELRVRVEELEAGDRAIRGEEP